MKCMICKNVEMVKRELEEKLPASECTKCGGIWISANNYWNWLKSQGSPLPEKPENYTLKLEVFDSKQVKICPDCGHFLTRRKVGHGLGFCVDRCETCGGIWLDKNEWEILKSRNLHDEIHFIFSEPWQRAVAQEENRKAYESHAEKFLGTADYGKISEFKRWLEKHPQKSFILAYVKNQEL